MRCLPLLAAIVLSSTPAAADYTEIAPVKPLTMSDPSGLSSVGLELQLTKWSEEVIPGTTTDFTNITFDLSADIKVAPHWVVLARLPLSKTSVDPSDPDCCDLALGNLTVGGRGLWASIFDNGQRAVAGGELSISLPTASDGGTRAASAGTGALAQLPHDPGRYAPNTTTVRFDLLGQLYSRRLFAHAQLGLHAFLYDSDVPGDSSDLAGHVGLAVGVRATYKLAIIAELNTLFLDNGFAGDNDTVSSLDFGIRYGSGRGSFGARLYVPVDSELGDLDMIGFGLDAALRF